METLQRAIPFSDSTPARVLAPAPAGGAADVATAALGIGSVGTGSFSGFKIDFH